MTTKNWTNTSVEITHDGSLNKPDQPEVGWPCPIGDGRKVDALSAVSICLTAGFAAKTLKGNIVNNSTFCIEEFDGEESDSSNAPFKIVFGGGNEASDSFLDRIYIFRDGDTKNISAKNMITHGWFTRSYNYEDFIEDYCLIHRLKEDKEYLTKNLLEQFNSQLKRA